jgi:diphosphomevalonate decarboxylase
VFTGEDQPAERSSLSRLSAKGSGSSARSFFSPWALWDASGAGPAPLKKELDHFVVLVEAEKKTVSSSEAHRRVSTSLLIKNRPERAARRLGEFLEVLESHWQRAYEIAWAEFWDMHALFETSHPPFGYMKPSSLSVLEIVRRFWEKESAGPLATMDAGANVHLLFRPEDADVREECLRRLSQWRVL